MKSHLALMLEELLEIKLVYMEVIERHLRLAQKIGETSVIILLNYKSFMVIFAQWLPHWNHFKKIHDDPDINNSHRTQYLLLPTIPGSRTRQLVESYPAAGEQYDRIINSLKSSFGTDDLQVEVYVH